MKSAIEEIFSGTIGIKYDFASKDSALANHRLTEQEKKLTEYIKDNPEAMKCFREYVDLFNESAGADVLDIYKAGFRCGFRIALDAAEEDETVFDMTRL